MKNKKKKNKKSLKKILKGFTLVELLAVIVILAIIMIIAIPAVLNTLQTARKKTMVEFAQKVLITGQRRYLEDKSFNGMANISRGMYWYSIKDDLGMSNTGEFDGFYTVWYDGNITEYNVYLWNNEFVLNTALTPSSEIDVNDIMTHNDLKQLIISLLNNNQELINKYSDFTNLSKKDAMNFATLSTMNCNNPSERDISVVDASKPKEVLNACELLNE